MYFGLHWICSLNVVSCISHCLPPSTVISKLLSFLVSNSDSCACSSLLLECSLEGVLTEPRFEFYGKKRNPNRKDYCFPITELRCLFMTHRSWSAFMYIVVNLKHFIKSKELFPLKGGRRPSGFGRFCFSVTQLPH